MTIAEPRAAPHTPSATQGAAGVLIIAFLMNLYARGFGETFSVFLLPISADLGWSRGDMTTIYAGYMIVHGLAAPFMGILIQRLGGRITYGLGLLCYGVGFILASMATELWHAWLGLSVLAGLGIAAVGMVPATAIISRWYDRNISTAMAIAYSGLGTGVIVSVPATQWLIQQTGWRATYWVLATVLLASVPLVFILPWRRWNAGSDAFRAAAANRARTPSRPWLSTALTSLPFYGLVAVFFFTSVAIYVVSVQAVAYLIDVGFPPLLAATAFGIVGVLSVVGMIGTGWLADRFNRRLVVTLSYTLTAAGVISLWTLQQNASFLLLSVFVLCFGLSQGARGPVISTLVSKLYPDHVGPIYGAVTIGLGLGAALGSWLSGYLYDLTGSYDAAFVVSLVASLAGASQFWISRPLATGVHVRDARR